MVKEGPIKVHGHTLGSKRTGRVQVSPKEGGCGKVQEVWYISPTRGRESLGLPSPRDVPKGRQTQALPTLLEVFHSFSYCLIQQGRYEIYTVIPSLGRYEIFRPMRSLDDVLALLTSKEIRQDEKE